MVRNAGWMGGAPPSDTPTAGSAVTPADERFLGLALEAAREARAAGEIPVGAVLVRGEEVLARAGNAPRGRRDPTAHAEILALRAGAERLDNYRLTGTTLYVTLEPCLMCCGALVHARVARLVYGCPDPKLGGTRVLAEPGLNHRVTVAGGGLADACAALLQDFFRERR